MFVEATSLRTKQSKLLAIDQHILLTAREKKPETVEQLIKLVQLRHPTPEQEIMKHILHLQNHGKLVLKEPTAPLPSTIEGYLLTTQATWFWAIIALALTTTTLVFTIPENAIPVVYARYLLGSIFVLWLPGYTFIKALFPTKELDNIERVALSIGMSLALVPITGLLLNYTPWGIRLTPVTISLLALTITFATAAIIREHQANLKEKQVINRIETKDGLNTPSHRA